MSKRTTLSERIMLQAERGASKLGTSSQMILASSAFILIVELLFALGMMVFFYYYPAYNQVLDPNPAYQMPCQMPLQSDTPVEAISCTPLTVNGATYVDAYHNWGTAAWWGFFHSVSTMNNAGFDVIGNFSLAPYRNDGGAWLQGMMMVEFTIGGIGFPLIFDVLMWFKTRVTGERFRFSLFTKVSLTAHVVLLMLGQGITYGTEVAAVDLNSQSSQFYLLHYDNSTGAFGANETFNKWWAITFTSFSARGAGFTTTDPHIFSVSTKYVQGILMFIGSAPSSTAGGIRTTTIAVMCVAVVKRMMGREKITMFKKVVSRDTVRNSFSVFFVAIVLVAVGVLIVQSSPFIDTTTTTLTLVDSFFEVSSAFGTTGYSAGLTPHLQWWTMLYLALVMFIGQLGVSSSILSWAKKESRHNTYAYPTEDLVIG